MRHIPLQLFLACLLITTGCFGPNLRTWKSSNLVATGSIKSGERSTYFDISIGTDESPYNGLPPFAIRLSNGIILSSDDFSEPTILEVFLTQLKPNDRGVRHDPDTGTSTYWFHGVSFTYREHRLITINLACVRFPEKTYIPEIAESKTGTFTPLPIPEKFLRQLFGPPDGINDHFAW
jgi:hypothetical protein